MKKSKVNFPIIFISIMIFFLFATGIASWIISISSHFILGEYSQIGEIISNLDTTTVTYDGDIHLPVILDDEVISNETYTIQFKEKDSTLFPQNVYDEDGYLIRGPINAGTYIISYKNKTNPDIVADVEFVVDKATPTLLESGYPTLGSTIYGKLPSITQATGTVATHPEHISSTTDSPVSVSGSYSFVDEYSTQFTEYSGNAATSTVSTRVLFTPSDTNNYYAVETSVNFTLEAVALYNSLYYGRIEDALEVANSAATGTVIALIGKNPTIYENCSVNSGVTLLIGYNNESFVGNRAGTNTFYADSTTENIELYRKNNVIVKDGITLTINGGTLNIDGVLGSASAGLSGATTGDYSQITLGENASIVLKNSATFNCYGYVKEQNLNNGSKVELFGAVVNMPFVIHDFRGGTNTVTVYKKGNIAPFNVFDMPNIQSNLFLYDDDYTGATGSSTIYGLVDLYANDAHNTDKVHILSSNSSLSALINMTSGYLLIKYNPAVLNLTSKELDTTNLEIHGDGYTATLTLTIRVMITVTVSLENIYFGIPYKLSIGFYDGTFNISNLFKLLPGSNVYIDDSATVNLQNGGKVIIYSSFKDLHHGGYIYPTHDEANLVVNGTLNVINGTLAGTVKTTNSGAILNVDASSSTEASSIEGNSGSTSSADAMQIGLGNTNLGEFIIAHIADEILRGLTVSSGNNYSSFSRGTYESLNGRWFSESCILYYDANGGTLTGDSYEPIDGTSYTTPYEIKKINTTNPVRDHYIFYGWYADPNCTIPVYTYDPTSNLYTAHNYIIYCNTYVYAKWVPITYTIEYEYIYTGFSEEISGEISNLTTTYNIETNSSLKTPVHSNNYVFGGWFTDDTLSTQVGNFIGANYVNTEAKFYGLWYPAGTTTYTITYNVINNDDVEFQWEQRDIVSFNTNTYTHQDDCTKYNDLNTYAKYFEGWYIDEQCTIPFENSHIVSNITIYGKWVDKHVVTFDWGEFSGSNSITSLSYYIKDNGTISCPDHSFDPELVDSYISWFVAKWDNGNSQYNCNEIITITSTVTFNLKKLENTRFYKTTVSNNYTSITITTANGLILSGIGDITGTSSFSFANNAAQSAKIIYIQSGSSVSCAFTYHKSRYLGYIIKNVTTGAELYNKQEYSSKPSNPSSFTLSYELSIESSSGDRNACIFSDAQILMVDGTTKQVTEIKIGDMVTTWSFEEGEFVSRPVIFVEKLKSVMVNKLTLYFDDNTQVEIAYAQSFFDIDKLEYFSINAENVHEYVGVNIMTHDNGNVSSKQIVDYKVEVVMEDVYELITGYDFSFIFDDVLSMEPFLLYKLPFEINSDLKYDEELMKEDIERYGLYTYEEWSMYASEELFNLLNGKYFKVAISKGHFTIEYLLEIIERYLNEDNLT